MYLSGIICTTLTILFTFSNRRLYCLLYSQAQIVDLRGVLTAKSAALDAVGTRLQELEEVQRRFVYCCCCCCCVQSMLVPHDPRFASTDVFSAGSPTAVPGLRLRFAPCAELSSS